MIKKTKKTGRTNERVYILKVKRQLSPNVGLGLRKDFVKGWRIGGASLNYKTLDIIRDEIESKGDMAIVETIELI